MKREISGVMTVICGYHWGKGKWMVEWLFNNTGGIVGYYDTQDEAEGVAALFGTAC